MKKTLIMMCLLLFLMPVAAQAHTALTSSNPAAEEVLTQSPEQIELTFGTDIEEGSSMTLQGTNEEIEVNEVSVSGNVMAGSLPAELENGQYTILWKIIGADGHPIEGEVPFSVEAETAEEPAVEEPVEEEAAEPEVEQPKEEQPIASETAAAENSGESNLLTIGLLGLLAILAIVFVVLLVKKKR